MTLEALSIEIAVDEEYIEEIEDDLPEKIEEVEEIPKDELVDPDALVEGISIDDPVRMYLGDRQGRPSVTRRGSRARKEDVRRR